MARHYRPRGDRAFTLRCASEIYQLRADVIHGRILTQEEVLELLEELDAHVDLQTKFVSETAVNRILRR